MWIGRAATSIAGGPAGLDLPAAESLNALCNGRDTGRCPDPDDRRVSPVRAQLFRKRGKDLMLAQAMEVTEFGMADELDAREARPEVAQQGFASAEPFIYKNEVKEWGKDVAFQLVHDAGWQPYSGPLAIRTADLDKLKPKTTGVVSGLDLGVAGRRNDYAIRFHGLWKVDRDDTYKFAISSDDGSRLIIDGKTVLDNDGIHPNTTREGTAELKSGLHKVEVWYFQGGGEDELALTVQGRHLQLVDIGQVLVASEKDLATQAAARTEPDADTIVPDPALAKEGRTLFASLGCAQCHQLKEGGKAIASGLKAPGMTALKAEGGCLAEAPKAGLPRYSLNAAQRVALVAGLKAPLKPAGDNGTYFQTLAFGPSAFSATASQLSVAGSAATAVTLAACVTDVRAHAAASTR